MTQRVSRAERLRRQKTGDRGFVYRRRLADFAPILKALYPMPGTPARDWPSAATVLVDVVVSGTAVDELTGRYDYARVVPLSVRVPKSASGAEARARAVAKLRPSVAEAWRISVGPARPDGVPAVPGVVALTYRVCPLFEMVKREVVDG